MKMKLLLVTVQFEKRKSGFSQSSENEAGSSSILNKPITVLETPPYAHRGIMGHSCNQAFSITPSLHHFILQAAPGG